MRSLLVGKRAGSSGISEGPVTAFESLVAGFRDLGEQVNVFPDRPRSRLSMYWWLFVSVFRRWDIINVHLTANFGLLIGLILPRSQRTALTIHGFNPIESSWNPYNAFMHRVQVRYLFRNRIYVSSLIRQRVEAMEGLSGGVVIPNAVSPLPMAGSGEGPIKDIDVFTLCGYSVTKGSAVFIEAVNAIPESLRIVMAGHGSSGHTDERSSRQKVQCSGPLTLAEISFMFARTKIYVQPSLYESFGIPVVEAMYAGIPVVVSTGAGVAEFLTDGLDALVVPPRDPLALADAIRRLLGDRDLATRLSQHARATAKQFAPSTIAVQYREYFERVRMKPRERLVQANEE